MHSVADLGVCLGDFDGDMGWHNDRFYSVHGEYGVGQR